MGRRSRPKVEHYVEDRSLRAANQLRLKRGRLLEMYAPKRPLPVTESHIRLDRNETKTMRRKFPRTPNPHESPALILVRARIDYPCAHDASLGKTQFLLCGHDFLRQCS